MSNFLQKFTQSMIGFQTVKEDWVDFEWKLTNEPTVNTKMVSNNT